MSGALKVGGLYVAVTASIGEALTNLGKVADAVEKAAKQVKEKSKGLGEIGAAVAAGIAGAVAAASKSNAAMERETERMTALLYTLAADVGDAFLPVVQHVADGVEHVVASFQSLSPEMKAAASDVLVWVAGAGLAAGALGKVAGVVESVATGAGGLVKVLGFLNKSVALASLAASMDKVTASMVLPSTLVDGRVSRLDDGRRNPESVQGPTAAWRRCPPGSLEPPRAPAQSATVDSPKGIASRRGHHRR